MQLALVHDWLNQRGGAEKVLESLVTLFPHSPLYTSLFDPDVMPDHYQQWSMHTLWTDQLPFIHQYHQPYLLLYPLAWSMTDLSSFDVIVTNKSGFCHGVHHDTQTLHICYCLTPTRYVWQPRTYLAQESFGNYIHATLQPCLPLLRRWDWQSAQRVHYFIAISTAVQKRIQHYYQRPSVVIYPPVDTDQFDPAPTHDDYFLCVSRLIPYKRIDLAVQAATQLHVPLKIVGTGRDLTHLQQLAGPTIEFLGFVDDTDLNDLFARCKAFLFPGGRGFWHRTHPSDGSWASCHCLCSRWRSRYRHPPPNWHAL